MIKPKLWDGKDLKGEWVITLKLDGVRMLRDSDGNPVSRAGKPLYNLDHIPSYITDAEIFINNWETTVSHVRTKTEKLVDIKNAYSLNPLDERLILDKVLDPRAIDLNFYLKWVVSQGCEGLVLHQEDRSIKIKPRENYDVAVVGATEGKGKYKGLIGALITPMGKVSGMTDKQRKEFTDKLPEVIEVECMGLTKTGKFRHPRFVRERFDKLITELK